MMNMNPTRRPRPQRPTGGSKGGGSKGGGSKGGGSKGGGGGGSKGAKGKEMPDVVQTIGDGEGGVVVATGEEETPAQAGVEAEVQEVVEEGNVVQTMGDGEGGVVVNLYVLPNNNERTP